MTITAQQIAALRAKTGLPMMECKKALVEANGDEEKAISVLRKKGIAKADSKGERAVKAGLIDSYIHNGGKIGVLLEVDAETDFVTRNEEFKQFVHDIALHIAGRPRYIKREDVDLKELEEEKSNYFEQVKAEGKPDNIIEKIVDGKLEKYYSEVCLLDQPFVKDDKITISDFLKEKIAKIGENIVIVRFVRYEIGK